MLGLPLGPMQELTQDMEVLRKSTDTLPYRGMVLVTLEDYESFAKDHDTVQIGESEINLVKRWSIKSYAPAQDYKPEHDTVWSFPDRGDWATHVGNYRGNWSPYIPRNLILKYTQPGELVVDQMVGSGTTLIECKLLSRNGIGVDINPDAIMVARDRLNFSYSPLDQDYPTPVIQTYVGDARNLNLIEGDSIDLVATHPPYSHIIPYSGRKVEGDLSSLSLNDYLSEMRRIAEESLRVLKPDRYCAVLIGDTRKHRHYVPISTKVLELFLEAGFLLKEDIIKLQWKTKTTRERWRGKSYDFYLIAHEHLFVFRKPSLGEKISAFKYSARNAY